MDGLHYPRPCGCKGIRSCLVCEGIHSKAVADTSFSSKAKYNLQNIWQYCYLCGRVQLPEEQSPHEASSPVNSKDIGCCLHQEDEGFLLPGIQVLPDFITEAEEMEIVRAIEQSPWKASQSGRYKQDYGPKPNFKRRKVKPGGFCGLPSFIEPFVTRMTRLDTLRDFLPVEQCHLEYTPERGSAIDFHFDDFWLWGKRLVTLNLLSDTILLLKLDDAKDVCGEAVTGLESNVEACTNKDSKDRNLSGNGEDDRNHSSRNDSDDGTCCGIDKDTKHSGENYKNRQHSGSSYLIDAVSIPMPRRSLLVLSDEARYKWQHAIPREAITSRRIAVTLRELASDFLPGGPQEVDGQTLLDIALTFKGQVVP